MKQKAKDVDAYIANADPAAHPIMEELREIIKSTIPETEETISWNVPIYTYFGILVGFSVSNQHVSFGVDTLPDEARERLKEKGYKTGKKTIQIGFDQKVPVVEIKKSLKAQAKINEAKKVK